MNTKKKGATAERRAKKILEAAGYLCLKAGGSLGRFDLVALGPHDVRCIQVKAGRTYCSAVEREQLVLTVVAANVTKEIWRFPDRCKEPLIERL